MKKYLLILSGLLLLTSCQSVQYKKFVRTLPEPTGSVAEDVRYRKNFRQCSLDIYLPDYGDAAMVTPAPVYIFIHGGAWMFGSKDFLRLYSDTLITPLRKKGAAVVSIGYRFFGQTLFQNISKDIHEAMEFLRRESEIYGLDMNRVVLHGQSAGAHLALLEGFRHPEGILLIVDEFGPTDLVALQEDQPAVGIVSRRIRRQESPTEWVSPQIPPVAIWHGDADELVPISQTEILIDKIESVGGDVGLCIVPGADHGYMNMKLEKSLEISKAICETVAGVFGL